MDIIIYLIIGVVALAVGIVSTTIIQKSLAKSRAKSIIDEATAEAENIKKAKILEAREEELKIKAEAEKQANNRMAKIQQTEAKMKQRELQLNQQQSENQRQRNDIEATKANLDAQFAIVETKKSELDKLKRTAQEELEHISGLSSEEAKEKLIESLKDEAKTAADEAQIVSQNAQTAAQGAQTAAEKASEEAEKTAIEVKDLVEKFQKSHIFLAKFANGSADGTFRISYSDLFGDVDESSIYNLVVIETKVENDIIQPTLSYEGVLNSDADDRRELVVETGLSNKETAITIMAYARALHVREW